MLLGGNGTKQGETVPPIFVNVLSGWKEAAFKLIAKSSAQDDPHSPSNFRPIALTMALSKLLSGILKDRWLKHMSINGYLDLEV